ncbi:MAG: hypothetical protein NT104_01620 [Bacteroidetes bacterium]|nr:hypothetical protein [Bacteroidota bacterium]
MKKIIFASVLMISFTFLSAQEVYSIEIISNFGKKINAEGSSITFNDSAVIFVTSLGGKTNTHNLKIVSKDLAKSPPTYNCTGKIGENYTHQFKIFAKKHLVVWNSIKENKTLVERFLFIKQDESN